MTAFDSTVGLNELVFTPSPSPDEESRRRRRRLRRRFRMISNRESARRSRMRLKHHLVDLRSQAEQLQEENRYVSGHLRAMIYGSILLRRHNARLHSESDALRRRLRVASRAGYLYTSCRWLSCLPPPPPPPPSSAVAAGNDPTTLASLMA